LGNFPISATSSLDGKVAIWSNALKPLKRWSTDQTKLITSLGLKNGRLATGDWKGIIKIWNPFTGTCEKVLKKHTQYNSGLVELADGTLISCSPDKTIIFWDLSKPENEACIKLIDGPQQSSCRCISLLNDEEISCGSGRDINIYKFRESTLPAQILKGHYGEVIDLVSHPNQTVLLSASEDKNN